MKIATYQRQVGPGGVPSGAGLSIGAATLPSRAIGEAAEGLTGLGQAVREVEDKLEHSANVVRAAKLTSDFSTFMAAEIDKLPRDPDNIDGPVTAYQQAGEAWLKQAAGGIKDPVARAAIEASLTNDLTRKTTQARGIVRQRLHDSTKAAGIEGILESARKGTVEGLAEAQAMHATLERGGFFSPEQANELRGRIRTDSLNNAFSRLADADHHEALRAVNSREGIFQGATDAERDRFKGEARTRIQTEENRLEAIRTREVKAQEKRDKEMERAVKESQEATEDTVRQLIRSGAGNVLDEIYRMGPSGTRQLSSEGQRRLIAEYDTRQKAEDRVSDPDVLMDAKIRVRQASVNQKDRDWLRQQFQAGRLNVKDYDSLDDKATQNISSAKDERKALVNDRHTQAEQMVRIGLGIHGPLEILTQDQKKAYDLSLQELTQRSSRYDGKEDPLAVAQEILPKYKALIGDVTIVDPAAFQRMANELDRQLQAGQISPEKHRQERQRILEQSRKQRPPQTPAPSTGKWGR